MPNLFHFHKPLPDRELCDDLIPDRGVKIERIISSGQTTPEGEWYDQARDEWVVLLRGLAVLEYADGSKHRFGPGDYVFIPAHTKHRVIYTNADPPCVWLAVHGSLG